MQPVYGLSSSSDPARFARAVGHLDVVYAEDPVVPLSSVLDAELPPVPWEAGVAVHWLAVNGKQPVIPENTPLLPPSHRDKRQRTEAARQPLPALVPPPGAAVIPAIIAGAGGAAAVTAGAAAGAIAAGTSAATPAVTGALPLSVSGEGAGGGTPAVGAAAAQVVEEGSLVRAPLKHIVSKELHLYYRKVETTLQTAEPAPAPPSRELLAVLSSLRTDAGLQPLAPYLSHLIATGVATHLASVPRLSLFLRAAVSLGSNPSLDLGPYLHEIMPAVLTCLLARSVGEISSDLKDGNGTGGSGGTNSERSKKDWEESAELDPDALHWGVREEAARAAAALCFTYPDAAPRVQRQLVAALTAPGSSLATRYGAVVGIEAQGPRAVRALLLPNLIPAVAALAGDLAGARGGGGGRSLGAALRVRGALLAAAGYCVYLSGVCAPWGAAGTARNGAAAGAGALPSTSKEPRIERVEASIRDNSRQMPNGKKGGKSNGVKKPLRLAKIITKGRGSTLQRGGASSGLLAALRRGAGVYENGKIGSKDKKHPLKLRSVFGQEEEEEESTIKAQKEAAAAAEWLKNIPPTLMRPASPGDSSGIEAEKGAGGLNLGAESAPVPSENYLAEAWREDFPVGKLRQAMEELFGADVVPYERTNGNKGGNLDVVDGLLGKRMSSRTAFI